MQGVQQAVPIDVEVAAFIYVVYRRQGTAQSGVCVGDIDGVALGVLDAGLDVDLFSARFYSRSVAVVIVICNDVGVKRTSIVP